jgi:chemotaxis protein histidine kinase CheA
MDSLDNFGLPPSHNIGGNNPPEPLEILRLELEAETATLLARAKEITAAARKLLGEEVGPDGTVTVTAKTLDTEDAAGKATALAKMLRDHASDVDAARERRKKKPLEEGRLIDAFFKEIYAPLVGPDPKKPAGFFSRVVAMVNAYRQKKDEEIAAERRRIEAEARAAREKEEAAERARLAAIEAERIKAEENAAAILRAQQAAAAAAAANDQEAIERAARDQAAAEAKRRRDERTAQDSRVAAEIAAGAAAATAEKLEAIADNTVATAIDSGYGAKASGRIVPVFEIEDFAAALAHAVIVDKPSIEAALRGVIDRMMKAKVRSFPGVKFSEKTITVVR